MSTQDDIRTLITLSNDLPYRDEEKLQYFLAKAKAVIRQTFGGTSVYLNQIEHVTFHPASFFVSEYTGAQIWKDGVQDAQDILRLCAQETERKNDVDSSITQTDDVPVSERNWQRLKDIRQAVMAIEERDYASFTAERDQLCVLTERIFGSSNFYTQYLASLECRYDSFLVSEYQHLHMWREARKELLAFIDIIPEDADFFMPIPSDPTQWTLRRRVMEIEQIERITQALVMPNARHASTLLAQVKRLVHTHAANPDAFVNQLTATRFKPASIFVEQWEEQESWDSGLERVRQILSVLKSELEQSAQRDMLEQAMTANKVSDPVEETVGAQNAESSEENVWKNRVAELESELNQLKDYMTEYMRALKVSSVSDAGSLPLTSMRFVIPELQTPSVSLWADGRKIYCIASKSDGLNESVRVFLQQGGAEVVFVDAGQFDTNTIGNTFEGMQPDDTVIALLSEDSLMDIRYLNRPNYKAVFYLGHLKSLLSADRLAVLHDGSKIAREISDSFDVPYISCDDFGEWKMHIKEALCSMVL